MKIKNIYYTKKKAEEQMLDIFLPDNCAEEIPLFIYFHGGGLEACSKEEMPYRRFVEKNVGVVSVNYRMYPDYRYPDFLQDGAASVKWVLENISRYANAADIYVGGSSAGAYIAMMLCFDNRYFSTYGVDINKISGFVFNAGQPTTHFNVLRERGLDPRRCVVDEAAPLYHITEYNNQPPMLIFCADNDMASRYEQTLLLIGTLKEMNYPERSICFEYLQGHSHCDYIDNDAVFADRVINFITDKR